MDIRKFGMVFGAVITVVVVGSLAYLHLFATAEAPNVIAEGDDGKKVEITVDQDYEWPVRVCTDAPETAEDNIAQAQKYAREHNQNVSTTLESGDCAQTYTSDSGRTFSYEQGKILVTLAATWQKPDHPAVTEVVWSKKPDGTPDQLQGATIFMPETIFGSDDVDETRILPKDIDALVMTHELLHALGKDHTRTKVAGPVVAEKTGHILNPSLYDLGWNAEGL